ncbi:MAG: serine/threonine protein kinase [Sandaracinaceae bacterium]|jgi:serine/threonine protein kinase|nr:serine/threonine protein kinase [Sandaracinaceae bacterium]MBP7684913.1 serine/threonine protein kinase [Deltaproteobacteria bacterium]MBK6808126.1 serine/threonine protein kinase [Sandaracinaceae bacterium]MBK7151031.1 serine/threonine protein kinase [Sandaracinaceae bacterium]MBK7773150.1 serine/threonine protein kinase [Sandaracinaceae bacterium]
MQNRFIRCPHCGVPHDASVPLCPTTGQPVARATKRTSSNPAPATAAAPAAAPKAAPVSAPSSPADVILGGRYRLLHILGEGGMGTVWAAEHQLLKKLVAVKLLLPQQLHGAARKRFEREARMAGSIGHPSIVKVFDLGHREDGAPYLVMEYLKGESLADRLETYGALDVAECVTIMTQVLGGLAAAHEKGIVHRDLKPDNIFLARQDDGVTRAKLLDFGVSKSLDENTLALTRTGAVIGTPYYLSPEQARGDQGIDHRVDLWAAGVVLYEMLTGQLPFIADNYNALLVKILMNAPVPPSRVRPSIPLEMEAIVLRALEQDREHRFPSAQVMLDALARVQVPNAKGTGSARRAGPKPTEDDDGTLVSTDVHLGEEELSVTSDLDEPTQVSDSFVFDALRRTGTLEVDVDIDLGDEEEGAQDEQEATLVSDSIALDFPHKKSGKP